MDILSTIIKTTINIEHIAALTTGSISKDVYNTRLNILTQRKQILYNTINTNYLSHLEHFAKDIIIRKDITNAQLIKLQNNFLTNLYRQNTRDSEMLYNYIIDLIVINNQLWTIEHLVDNSIDYDTILYD